MIVDFLSSVSIEYPYYGSFRNSMLIAAIREQCYPSNGLYSI